MDRDGLHIASGESIALAKAILMEGGNGLGIKNYFGEKATEKQYKGKDALEIRINGTKQVVIFVGHKKSNSWQGIRGLTAMSSIMTEASVAHSSFIQETLARTMSAPSHLRKIFMDLNPTVAQARIYTEFIDAWIAKQDKGESLIRVNFETVSIFDNPSMSREQIERELSLEDPNSAWFKAMYLGERIASADTVYTLYPYNIIPSEQVGRMADYVIAVDIGVSQSATTFVTVIRDKDNVLYVPKPHYWHKNGTKDTPKTKMPEDYAEDLAKYYMERTDYYDFAPKAIIIDRDVTFFRILKRVFQKYDLPTGIIRYAKKEKISARITTTSNLLYTNQLRIEDGNDTVISAFRNAVYDDKQLEKGKLERLDDTKLDVNPIDTLDGVEYAITYYTPILYRQ